MLSIITVHQYETLIDYLKLASVETVDMNRKRAYLLDFNFFIYQFHNLPPTLNINLKWLTERGTIHHEAACLGPFKFKDRVKLSKMMVRMRASLSLAFLARFKEYISDVFNLGQQEAYRFLDMMSRVFIFDGRQYFDECCPLVTCNCVSQRWPFIYKEKSDVVLGMLVWDSRTHKVGKVFTYRFVPVINRRAFTGSMLQYASTRRHTYDGGIRFRIDRSGIAHRYPNVDDFILGVNSHAINADNIFPLSVANLWVSSEDRLIFKQLFLARKEVKTINEKIKNAKRDFLDSLKPSDKDPKSKNTK
jgi:hypothetical protein